MIGLNRAVRMSRHRIAWLCLLAIPPAAGCGLLLGLEIESVRQANPSAVPAVQATGLADLIPSGEYGACGPGNILADVILDCPMAGICFTAACTSHDLCYSTCGSSQSDCDGLFFWDMVYLCDRDTSNVFDQNRCYTLAWIYYQAVQRYGAPYFDITQEIVCARLPEDEQGMPPDSTPVEATAPAAGHPVAALFVDTDDDLMPDDWEIEVGLDPTDPQDAWLDCDHDGVVNLGEFIRDTDPYVPAY